MRANTQNIQQGEQETRGAGEGRKKLWNRDMRRSVEGSGMVSVKSHTLSTRVEEVSNPRVELAFDSIDRVWREGRMPDCIKSSIYVQRDGPDVMSDTEGLHSLLRE